MLQEAVAVVLVLVCLLLLYGRWRHQYWQKKGVYSPPGDPLLGHFRYLLALGKMRFEFMHEEYEKHKDQKMFGLFDYFQPNLSVHDLHLVQSVLIKDFDHFVDRRTFDIRNEVFNEMLTNASGSHWKGIRSVLTPTFTSGKMKHMFHLVKDKSDCLVQYCMTEKDAKSALDLKTTFGKYTIDVIGSCAFGIEINSLKGENKKFTDAAQKLFKPSFMGILIAIIVLTMPFTGKFFEYIYQDKTMLYFIDTVKSTITSRKKGPRRDDFVDLMLDAKEKDNEIDNTTNDVMLDSQKTVGEEERTSITVSLDSRKVDGERASTNRLHKYKLTDNTICAQAILFMLAGFDTTANTLTFAAHLLAQHSKYQNLIRDELNERVKQNPDEELAYQDIMEAPYLEAVLSESLRLYPPATFTERKCTKEYNIPGTSVTVPEGMIVSVPIWSIQRDSSYFEDPNEFKPERFLSENKYNIHSGSYLPFGLGPRMCIAQRFAQMEAKLALAKLVLNFNLKVAPGYEKIKLLRTPGVLRPDGDLMLVFEELK